MDTLLQAFLIFCFGLAIGVVAGRTWFAPTDSDDVQSDQSGLPSEPEPPLPQSERTVIYVQQPSPGHSVSPAFKAVFAFLVLILGLLFFGPMLLKPIYRQVEDVNVLGMHVSHTECIANCR